MECIFILISTLTILLIYIILQVSVLEAQLKATVGEVKYLSPPQLYPQLIILISITEKCIWILWQFRVNQEFEGFSAQNCRAVNWTCSPHEARYRSDFCLYFWIFFALVVEGWWWFFISRSRPDRMFWPVWILGGCPASRASAVQVSQFHRNHRHHHHHNCNHHQRWCIALMEHPVIQKCQSVEKLESFKSIFLQRRSIFILWYMESWILLALGWN